MGILKEATWTGLFAGAGATAAVLISSPVGAAGGAVFGATSYLAGKPVEWICSKVFNTDKKQASTISKIVGFAAGFLATAAVTFGIMTALGISTTFGAVCVLSAATLGVALTVGAVAYVIL